MNKKILVFNGSPKKEKSDTLHITKAFLEGMKSINDYDITIVDVIDKNINYCKGCFTCKKNGGKCVYNDDMENILKMILQTDIIIWSFPLYAYSMPAHLKVLIDRTMPLSTMAMHEVNGRYEHYSQYDFSKIKYVMISGCGFPNFKNNFEPMVQQFINMFGEEDSTIITVPEAPMFNVEEAKSVTEPFLKVIEEAGKQYAKNGEISEEIKKQILTPMIPPEVYEKIANGDN